MTSTSAIAQMYIRKQNIFTEKKIFPYAKMEDLRLDLLPKIRVMAQNHAGGQHPWTAMDDQELLKRQVIQLLVGILIKMLLLVLGI